MPTKREIGITRGNDSFFFVEKYSAYYYCIIATMCSNRENVKDIKQVINSNGILLAKKGVEEHLNRKDVSLVLERLIKHNQEIITLFDDHCTKKAIKKQSWRKNFTKKICKIVDEENAVSMLHMKEKTEKRKVFPMEDEESLEPAQKRLERTLFISKD
jgi:hypothetical protein